MKYNLRVFTAVIIVCSTFWATALIGKPATFPKMSYYLVDSDLPDASYLQMRLSLSKSNMMHSFSVFSHGKPGAISLKGRWYEGKSLNNILLRILPAGTEKLYLWGCDFAKGEKGMNAVRELERQLKIEVSASDDITGRDGDWVLEIGNVDFSHILNEYRYSLQCDPLCIINEKAVGSFVDFESNTFITDRLGNTRELAGAGVGRYDLLTYGSTSGADADATITLPWGNTSLRPQNPGSKYLGGNDITGGESWIRTANPFVTTTPYLDFTGATQFCFDYFDASIDGTNRSTALDVIIYHGGSPNNHTYLIDLNKASGDATNAGGVTYSPSVQSAFATLNGVNPPTNPTTTEWSVKPGWVRFCIPLTGFNLAQVRGIQIHSEGINNGVSNQERWGVDNIVFSAPCNNPCSMPVTLMSFQANQSAEGIKLTWKTADEKDFDRFEIEQSNSPQNGFDKLGVVKGGNSEYSFIDRNIQNALKYYRLKMVDDDGTYRYSRIVTVKNWNGVELDRIYPNPTAGRSISVSSVAPITSYRIFDASGNTVQATLETTGEKHQFLIHDKTAPGAYILTYTAGGVSLSKHFVLK